jgi:ferric-dicitrate binding protein FerR (iron transport regulator)
VNKPKINFLLLWKKLSGTLDAREKQTLDHWLEADEQNQELMDKLEAFQKKPVKISDEQRDLAWQRLKSTLDVTPVRPLYPEKSGILKILYRAAAVFLLAATAALLWSYYYTRTPAQTAEVTLLPGRAKATLVIAGGQSIALGDSAVNLSQRGVDAEASGTALTYFHHAAAAVEQINTLIIPRGGEFQLTLADGTRVWLNAESTIRYPAQFTGAVRRVELTGEAYFEVAKNKEHPFEVVTAGQTIAVLGTSFNVTAYPDEPQVRTTLVEGKVAVHPASGKSMQITPGIQSVLDVASGELSLHEVDTDLYTSWKDGLFIFEDEALANILARMARWYDVEIHYVSSGQKNSRFTAHVDKYQSAAEVLKLMQATGAVAFEVDEKIITVK